MVNHPLSLPFDYFKKNKISQSWDIYVQEQYQREQNFDVLIAANADLKVLAKPRARKEVAKSLLADGVQPDLFAQKFDINFVLGDVGEAISELLLPPDTLAQVNQPGWDVSFQGAAIEVKTTSKHKVSMSGKQFSDADYLLIHRFSCESGLYSQSYLIPMVLARIVKSRIDAMQRVSFNLDKEGWIKHFSISPRRLVAYFDLRTAYLQPDDVAINTMMTAEKITYNPQRYPTFRTELNLLSVASLFVQSADCECWKWEQRFAYFQYHDKHDNKASAPDWFFDQQAIAKMNWIGWQPLQIQNLWQSRHKAEQDYPAYSLKHAHHYFASHRSMLEASLIDVDFLRIHGHSSLRAGIEHVYRHFSLSDMVFVNNEYAGFVVAQQLKDQHFWVLAHIEINDNFQRQGIATRIIYDFIHNVLRRGGQPMVAPVSLGSAIAHLCQKLGFVAEKGAAEKHWLTYKPAQIV